MRFLKFTYWYWMWKTFLKPSRLRKRFTRIFLLSSMVPLLLMGLGSFVIANRIHRIDVATIEHNAAVELGQNLTRAIDDALTDLKLEVAFDQFAPIKFTEQNFILNTLMQKRPALAEVSLICTTPEFCEKGRDTGRVRRADTQGPVPLIERSAASEFQAAAAGSVYRGILERDAEHFIILAAPVFNKRQEIVSVVRGVLSFAPLEKLVKEAVLGEKGYAYIVNEQGIILIHPNTQFYGINVAAVPSVRAVLARPIVPKDKAAENFFYPNLSREAVSGTGVFLPETKWGVIVEWPRAETEHLITVIIIQIILFSALAVLVIVISAGVLTFRMIAPVSYLIQSANIIGSGNFNYRTAIRTGDELEDLGNHLNQMAHNLRGLEELHELKLRTKYLSENLAKEKEFSKLKDQFITTVSHQFNTPLAAINWTLEEIQKPGTAIETVHEGFQRIAESSRAIGTIANDLITLSEIGFSYQMKKIEPINLETITRSVLVSFSSSLAAKKIVAPELRVTGNPEAQGNAFTVTKVIENLVDNAIAYSHEGGLITMAIRGDENEIRFDISDKGIGIPETDQSSIFQEFFRARNAVTKKNVGTGLGLFLVKTIVEKGFKGRVWFASKENEGTTFSFIIPKAPPRAELESPPLTEEPAKG